MSEITSQINELNWDSDFFNINIGQLVISREEDIKQLNLEKRFSLIYLYSSFELKNSISFSYQGTKIEFWKKIKGNDTNQREYSDILNIDADYFFKFEEELRQLAYLSGHQSRFNKDPLFDDSDFKRLYNQWLENALSKSHDNIFLVYHDPLQNLPVAFLTGSIDELRSIARVGLFAVDESQQGKGIGKTMLNYFEQLAMRLHCEIIVVPTQKENNYACMFYEAQGYTASPIQYIYHYWK